MGKKICGECRHLERAEHFNFQCKHCNGAVSAYDTACSHFSKRYGICPECGSYLFFYDHTEDNDWQLCTCDRCGCSGTPDEFLYNSVFARITASLEALAEKLVFPLADDWWMSSIIDDGTRFATREGAVAATVNRLKEVAGVDES